MDTEQAHGIIDWTSRPEIKDFPSNEDHRQLIEEAHRVVAEARLRLLTTVQRIRDSSRTR